MTKKKVCPDFAWIERELPIKLRARGLRPFMRADRLPPEKIAHWFRVHWRRGCAEQITLLYAMFWKRETDCARELRNVTLMYAQLREHDPPFMVNSVRGLKEKHVGALLARWDREGLSPETVRKRMGQLRDFVYWFEKCQVVDNVLRRGPPIALQTGGISASLTAAGVGDS